MPRWEFVLRLCSAFEAKARMWLDWPSPTDLKVGGGGDQREIVVGGARAFAVGVCRTVAYGAAVLWGFEGWWPG